MRRYETDYRLWAMISGGLFGPVLFVWLVFEGVQATLRVAFLDVLAVVIGFAVAGWVLQAVAVVNGVRLSGRTDPPDAPDYDDNLSPPTD
jgi:hypothetical protein